MAGTSSVISGPSIVCCNGGYPFVDLLHWQAKSTHFFPDLGPDADNCQSFRSKFFNEKSYQNYKNMNGNLACKCKSDYYGSQCQLKRDDADLANTLGNNGNNGSSFKMSLFLAVVPLTFAVFAAVGGFFCKMFPCCVCFNLPWPKNCPRFGRKMSGDSADYDDGEFDDDLYRQNVHVDVHSVDLAPVDDWMMIVGGGGDIGGNYRHEDTGQGNSSSRLFPSPIPCATNYPCSNLSLLPPNDPPPPFSPTDEPQQHCNCSRKYSPPPPYSEISAHSSNPVRTTSTQTFT